MLNLQKCRNCGKAIRENGAIRYTLDPQVDPTGKGCVLYCSDTCLAEGQHFIAGGGSNVY